VTLTGIESESVLFGYSSFIDKVNKKLSCFCDSRSYCIRRMRRMANCQTGFGYKCYKLTNGWYARSDSTGGIYESTQTQSTQAWLTKVLEVSE